MKRPCNKCGKEVETIFPRGICLCADCDADEPYIEYG